MNFCVINIIYFKYYLISYNKLYNLLYLQFLLIYIKLWWFFLFWQKGRIFADRIADAELESDAQMCYIKNKAGMM